MKSLTEPEKPVSSTGVRQAMAAEVHALLADSERLKEQLSLLSKRCGVQPLKGVELPRLSFALFAVSETCSHLKALSSSLSEMSERSIQAVDEIVQPEKGESRTSAEDQGSAKEDDMTQLIGATRALDITEMAIPDITTQELQLGHEDLVETARSVKEDGDSSVISTKASPNTAHVKNGVVHDTEPPNKPILEPVAELAGIDDITTAHKEVELRSPDTLLISEFPRLYTPPNDDYWHLRGHGLEPEFEQMTVSDTSPNVRDWTLCDHDVEEARIEELMLSETPPPNESWDCHDAIIEVVQNEIFSLIAGERGKLHGSTSYIDMNMIDDDLERLIALRMYWTPLDLTTRTIACLVQEQTRECVFSVSGWTEPFYPCTNRT